jgi:hypothetical protein
VLRVPAIDVQGLQRDDVWETGRANPHDADRPGFDEIQPWPPATLTPLGRHLLGLDAWPPG